jgi:NADPH:quinone reductase-like Zn-dependent oxidoreductase
MKSLVFERNGEPSEVLQLRDLPTPAIGPNEVLVKMHLAPVQRSDLAVIRARFAPAWRQRARQPEFPAVAGSEGMGTVAAVGAGARGFSVGARVVLLNLPGTWQEYVVCPAARAIPVPDAVSDEDAAQAMINPLTAWVLALGEHKLRSGEWLVQTAAGSVVGRLVLQLAKAHGFHTINLVRRSDQVAEIKDLGGDLVISTDEQDWATQLLQAMDSNGVAKAIDCVAGRVGATIARGLAPGGRMLVFGSLSSFKQTAPSYSAAQDPAAFEMPIFAPRLIYSATQVQGWILYNWFEQTELSETRRILEAILKLMADGSLALPKSVRYPLGRLQDAVKATDGVNQTGKPLLDFTKI